MRTWRGRLRRISSVPGMQTGVKYSWPMPSALWNLYLWRWTASALSTRTRNSSAPMSGENYDLTPRGIVRALHLLDVDYNAVSSYGHFGKGLLPWEE